MSYLQEIGVWLTACVKAYLSFGINYICNILQLPVRGCRVKTILVSPLLTTKPYIEWGVGTRLLCYYATGVKSALRGQILKCCKTMKEVECPSLLKL